QPPRRPLTPTPESPQANSKLQSLGLQTVSSEELILGAYPIVHQHGCAYYDALYLALARSLAIPLLTADNKFYQRFRGLPEVVWIGDLLL
ncbi:MAG TPA: type II toxin-antitoxin system VapC family toxin, partial [Chloroflexota bacterium]|nr:type II toxin-antitoxin system VapC family toxin [Chloroflexota bacterium]